MGTELASGLNKPEMSITSVSVVFGVRPSNPPIVFDLDILHITPAMGHKEKGVKASH